MLFETGRLHYQARETAAARRQFDLAIDTLIAAPETLPGRGTVEKKLAELVEAIHRYDVSGLGAGELPDEPVFDRSPLEDIPELTFPIDPNQQNKVIEELRATVSQLPLEVNDEVLRYVQYFSSGRGRRGMIGGLKRAGRYRHLIQRIFDEEGVPQELIHLAQAESGFKPRAASRRRAAGLWQFMRSRGREYGLIRTRSYDERFDPEKSTRAAARHLRDLYTRFGDWYLAMAAYNSGPLNVARAVQRTGYADFWELRRRKVLPRETLNYVPIILAMIIMAKNPAHYGLDTVEPDPPLEHSTVEIESPTHLALIADVTGQSVSEIRELNPALWRTVAPPGYSLRVPKGMAATVVSALEMVPASRRASWRIHRVGKGETLRVVARRYRASAKRISEVNQLDGAGLDAGNLLLIPSYRARRSVSKSGARRTTARSKTSSKAKSSPKTSTQKKGSTASSKRAGQRSATKTR
jgi:membrane-bound lytic murein transglycosylase D